MTITDQARRDLYESLRPTLGESADTLMELLPLHPTGNLASHEDMRANTGILRGEMAELRGDLRSEMAELRGDLRGEMAELRAELRGEMTELTSEMVVLRTELHSEMENLGTRLCAKVEIEGERNRAEMIMLVSGLRDEFQSRRANTAWTIVGTLLAVITTALAYLQVFGI